MDDVSTLARRVALRLARSRPLARVVPSACRWIGSLLGGSRVFGPASRVAAAPVDFAEMTFAPMSWDPTSGGWSRLPIRSPGNAELMPASAEPATGVFHLSQGRLLGRFGAVITNRDRLVAALSTEFHARGDGRPPALTVATLPRLVRRRGAAASLACAEGHNYYHWLVDSLPRLALLTADAEAIDALGEVWIAGPIQSYQLEMLDAMGVAREKIHALEEHSHLEFDRLVVGTRPRYPTDLTPWSFAFLRDQLRPRLLARATSRMRPRRFFLSRGDAALRNVENEAEILGALANLGFERVLASQLTAGDQAALFAGAEAVVAPHGAGLTNLVFANRGCSVLELQPNPDIPAFFANIARRLELRFATLTSAEPVGHASPRFRVDAAAVRAWAEGI